MTWHTASTRTPSRIFAGSVLAPTLFWEHEGLDALNARIDFLQARLEARLEAQREEESGYWHDCPHLEDEYLADREAEEWAEDERQLARDAQRAEEALELQWLHWEVLEMNLMGLRHRCA